MTAQAGSGDVPEGRQLFDLSISTRDSGEGDTYTVLPGYTFTYNNEVRLGITGSYTETSSDNGELDSVSGPGDTALLLQYDPSGKITSSPWIPDSIGLALGLTAPTGDAKKGLGGDQWLYSLGLGWAYNPVGNLYLAPAIDYTRSFNDGSRARAQELAGIGLSVIWVTPWGFWIGYTPYLERDLLSHEWHDDHHGVIGKMWPGGFGISLAYGREDRVDPTARRDDYTAFLNLYYQFGHAP